MSDQPTDLFGPEIRKLADLFEIQIPPTLQLAVVRRMLTIAARDQHQKITPEIADILRKLEVRTPQVLTSGHMSCFGTLFQATNRMCSACGLRKSCEVEARNVGLGEITLSPKLLGAKLNRVPAIIAGGRRTEPTFTSEGDEEIWNYLIETLHRDDEDHVTSFTLKDSPATVAFEVESPFRVRVVKPHSSLVPMLEKTGKTHYLPEGLSISESIHILDHHLSRTHATATV